MKYSFVKVAASLALWGLLVVVLLRYGGSPDADQSTMSRSLRWSSSQSDKTPLADLDESDSWDEHDIERILGKKKKKKKKKAGKQKKKNKKKKKKEPETCDADETKCGGKCVDLDHDPDNCGECGLECANNVLCGGGMCDGPTKEQEKEGRAIIKSLKNAGEDLGDFDRLALAKIVDATSNGLWPVNSDLITGQGETENNAMVVTSGSTTLIGTYNGESPYPADLEVLVFNHFGEEAGRADVHDTTGEFSVAITLVSGGPHAYMIVFHSDTQPPTRRRKLQETQPGEVIWIDYDSSATTTTSTEAVTTVSLISLHQ